MTNPDRHKDHPSDRNSSHHQKSERHQCSHRQDDLSFGSNGHSLSLYIAFEIIFIELGSDKPAVKSFGTFSKAKRRQQQKSSSNVISFLLGRILTRRFFFGFDQVTDSHQRVMKQHSWTRKAHHRTDLFTHLRLIAMHTAVGTEGFVFHKRAVLTPLLCVIQK